MYVELMAIEMYSESAWLTFMLSVVGIASALGAYVHSVNSKDKL